jgi:2-dehydropantoate 2-reductase
MRVVVIGAGIIGSIYGWALAESGHDVAHLVRPGRAAALREGLAVDILDRRKGRKRNFHGFYRLQAVETLAPADDFELVIVPVKHYALVKTLKEIVPRAGGADFLLLTQNWRGVEEIEKILPRARYIYGDAKAGGSFAGGGLVGALKAIDIGPAEGEPTALAKNAAALFESVGIEMRLHADMLHYLWVQYAMTGGPWAGLVQAGSFEAFLDDRDAIAAAFRAGRECLEVVRRRGVAVDAYAEAGPFLTESAVRRRFYGWVMRWMFRRDEYTRRCSAHALGDAVEVKTFYEDLVGTGRELGVSMRVMEGYSEAVRRFAARGSV